MSHKTLFHKTFISYALLGAAAAMAGCASLPDASTSVQTAECRIAPLTPASLTGGQKKPADKMDQIKAINDFARFEANTRLSPSQQLHFQEMLRDCDR